MMELQQMSGSKAGVAKQILDEQPKAIYTHCYAHFLNLAYSDTIRQSKAIRNAFDTAHEIVNLVKKIPSSRSFVGSPKRRAVITFTWYKIIVPHSVYYECRMPR